MTISQYQLDTMLARLARNKARANGEAEPDARPAERERGLHDEITLEVNRRGWQMIHARMDLPSTIGVGCPDFTVIADKGRTFLVEAKAGKNKPTMAQLAWLAWAKKLGHRAAVCRSLAEFVAFVDSP